MAAGIEYDTIARQIYDTAPFGYVQVLGAALDRAEANPAIRALVLTGAGRGFCAGADLSGFDFSEGPNRVERADPGPVIERSFNPTTRRLLKLRMPVLAAVNGVAAGAGASIAMACDIAIASPQASFIQAFSKIGLIPDAGGSWLLVERLGLARALALAMTGDKLMAPQAKEWGLIWDVVEDAELMAKATETARRLAEGPTLALARIKAALNESSGNDLSAQLDLERDSQRELGRSEDFKEGVMAFLGKRKANFKGK